MEVAREETEKWLGIQRWNPKPRVPTITRYYYLNNRILLSIREGDEIVYFGIKFLDTYPSTPAKFFLDWGGECNTKFTCYLAERMKNENCSTISCILGTVGDLFLYFKDLLVKQQEINQALENQDLYDENIQYLSDDEAEQLDEMEEIKFQRGITYTQGKILQVGMAKYGEYNLDIEGEIWHLFVSGIRYEINSRSFRIRIISPYVVHESVLTSGLVIIDKNDIYNLIPNLMNLAQKVKEEYGHYDTDLIDVQEKMLKDHELDIVKTMNYQVEAVDRNFNVYSCDVPEALFKELIEIRSILALELITESGIRTFCAIGNPHPYNNKIMIPKEVADFLRHPKRVRIRVVRPQTLKEITFKDVNEGFFNHPDHDTMIQQELIRYPVITLGQYLNVNGNMVVIKSMKPDICTATVLYQPGTVEVKVTYEKSEEHDPLEVPPYSHESESYTGPTPEFSL